MLPLTLVVRRCCRVDMEGAISVYSSTHSSKCAAKAVRRDVSPS